MNPIINKEGKITYWFNENNEFHREDGPALIFPNGTQEYWINDIEYSEEDY